MIGLLAFEKYFQSRDQQPRSLKFEIRDAVYAELFRSYDQHAIMGGHELTAAMSARAKVSKASKHVAQILKLEGFHLVPPFLRG